MDDQYTKFCREEFDKIKETVGKIETKIFDGFDDKITRTDEMVEKLDHKIDSVQKMIIGLMLSVIGGSFTIIMAMVFI